MFACLGRVELTFAPLILRAEYEIKNLLNIFNQRSTGWYGYICPKSNLLSVVIVMLLLNVKQGDHTFGSIHPFVCVRSPIWTWYMEYDPKSFHIFSIIKRCLQLASHCGRSHLINSVWLEPGQNASPQTQTSARGNAWYTKSLCFNRLTYVD